MLFKLDTCNEDPPDGGQGKIIKLMRLNIINNIWGKRLFDTNKM